MTKERKIAIEMWEYIRDNYDEYDSYIDTYGNSEGYEEEDPLLHLKHKFLNDKDIDWAMCCWFCEYIGHRHRSLDTYRCKLCPLQGCESGPYYVLTHSPTRDQYIDACEQIIVALGGEV